MDLMTGQRIGFVGAGFIGRALGRLLVQRGFKVMLSNSRGPESLRSTRSSVGCEIGSVEQACAFGEFVVLAIPFGHVRALPPSLFEGKVVIDASNYYPDRDGRIAALEERRSTTSQMVQAHLAGARVVKAFNAILERDIEKDALPTGTAGRRALPIAGDDAQAKALVAALQDRAGYDVVDAGSLAEGWRFERARPAYCVRLDRAALQRALSDDGPNRPEGSWRAASTPDHPVAVTPRPSATQVRVADAAVEVLARRAGLAKAVAEFPDDVEAAACKAATIRGELERSTTVPAAEPWPPTRVGTAP
jgi:predicted dinucleotide-binding enzyme